jgi:hypothetical protein
VGHKHPTAGDIAAMEYDLVDSATAFLTRSVNTMNDDCDTHTVAFAIAELATAVEVLMKARLLRHDWTQVCLKPGKWSFNDLKAGTAKTVAPEDAIERLDAVPDVDMTVHRAAIKNFARLRNRAVHFTLTHQGEQPVGVQAEYGRALDFVLSFLDKEFRGSGVGDDTTFIVGEVIEVLTTVVGDIRVLVDARMETLADELSSAAAQLVCPQCRLPALLLRTDSRARCAFCLWNPDDGRVAARDYVGLVLGGDEYRSAQDGERYPIDYCLQCGAEAYVEGLEPVAESDPDRLYRMHGELPLLAYWGCFSCGTTANSTDLERCSRCDTLTDVATGGGAAICSDCFAALVSSD